MTEKHCICGHPASYHDRDGFCCGDPYTFKVVGLKGFSTCDCHKFRDRSNQEYGRRVARMGKAGMLLVTVGALIVIVPSLIHGLRTGDWVSVVPYLIFAAVIGGSVWYINKPLEKE